MEPQTSIEVAQKRAHIWLALCLGLLPLILLIGLSLLTFALVIAVRQSLSPADFLTQQRVDLIMLVSGILLALIVYSVAIRLTLRRVSVWQQQGLTQQARIVLWELAGTALFIVLPLILAIILPQHPAP